jgi:transcriptional regulator with XRE-family HTH domain
MSKAIPNFWATNIRHLRRRKNLSQDEMAFSLNVSRSKLNAHENGQTINPTVDDLVSFSNYFKLSIDNLIKQDLSKMSELRLKELEAGNDTYTKGTQLRILATTVNPNNKDNIEYVSQKAKAGYLTGYSDPEFITKLPVFTMPHLPSDRKYRMFPTVGDSMYPIPEGALVVGQFIDDWNSIKAETPCLVITKEDGIVFKMVTNKIKANRSLLLASLNSIYEPYEVAVENVIEVWQFVNYITDAIPEPELSMQELSRSVQEIKAELKNLSGKK